MSVLTDLIESIVEMPGQFGDVLAGGTTLHVVVAGILLTIGAVLVLASSAVFGALTLGVVVDLVTPGSTGASHPEGR